MFLNPLGLLALIAVPAVVGLHLYRRRFRTQTVSALFLWEAAPVSSSVGRRRTPLRRNPSFWIELALAALVALAIAGPRGFGATEVPHVVVVLDGSASMAAVGGGSEPGNGAGEAVGSEGPEGGVRPRVMAFLEGELARRPNNSRVTILESGERPKLLYGPRGPAQGVSAELSKWTPVAGEHDFGPALDWATGLADGGEVLFITDTPETSGSPASFGQGSGLGSGPQGVRAIALGLPLGNVAILDAVRVGVPSSAGPGGEGGASRRGDTEAVYLTLANFGGRPRRVRCVVEGEGRELASSVVTLAGGESTEVRLESPADPTPWTAGLEFDGEDALEFDNRVHLVRGAPTQVAVHGVGEREFFEDLGLAAPDGGDGKLDRLLVAFPDLVEVDRIEEADWVITDRGLDGAPVAQLRIEASGPDRVDLIGPFLTDARDPWVRGLRLGGVVWSHGTGEPLPGRPLVMVDQRPLVTVEGDGAGTVVRMDYDPSRSTLSRVADWPLFLGNQLENVRAQLPGISGTQLRIGDPLVVRDLGTGTFHWTLPDGEVRTLEKGGDWSLEDVERAGVHRLQDPSGNRHVFSVLRCDPGESDLRGCRTRFEPEGPRIASTATELEVAEMILLMLGLLLVVADWIVLGVRTPRAPRTPRTPRSPSMYSSPSTGARGMGAGQPGEGSA